MAAALCSACVLVSPCTPARALILPPRTVAGPSSAIGEFGGAAMSADGSGGLVYTEQVGGVQHVFAAQYAGKQWRAPVRVDWQMPYAASTPRIAAADGGWLVVVWVAPIATVKGRVQQALYSSTMDPGSSSFGEQLIVDPNVGDGEGVDPSIALASSGQGLVAYRAITDNFKTSNVQTTLQPLRPGDVLADVRVARYDEQRWFAPVRINRNPRISMRPPNESNGPQVGVGRSNEAVVAWQEPEPNGSARIWGRRVFGATLGLAMQVSPTTFAGRQVTADATAFALSVSRLGEAKVVSLVPGGSNTPLGGPRMFVSTLPVSTATTASQFTTPTILGSPGQPPLQGASAPSVAVDDQGTYRIAFTAENTAQILSGGEQGPAAPEIALGPSASGSAGAVTALNPAGGGVTAWSASDGLGDSGLGVREDFPGGAAQSAFLSGAIDGPVSQVAAGGSESGEMLVGLREGPPGAYEIVAAPVTAPPPEFSLNVPVGWVTPAHARLEWTEAEDATGGALYSLILDGRVVQRAIRGTSVLPARRWLGSGVRHVQVLATDASGQQTVSGESELQVDGSPPVARVRTRRLAVTVSVRDRQSGAVAKSTYVSFGDRTRTSGKLTLRHVYAHPGSYVIVVHMRDRVGNGATAHLRATVR
ncbi:MAG TPA: hypothetical protein VHU13_07625 [Solirubrobacteraceae bacterium]|nr:hypothetical protein [Solirubrobacteraceae bacterium]